MKNSVDLHEWNQELTISRHSSDHGGLLGMRCGKCQRRRFGPDADAGNYYYFMYEQVPGGLCTEWVPPCESVMLSDRETVQTILICGKCGHQIKEEKCRYGCSADQIPIQFCRKV